MSQVNSYGHGRTVSSSNLTFFLGKLEQAVNQSLCTYMDLQSDLHLLPDTLPTALRGPVYRNGLCYKLDK